MPAAFAPVRQAQKAQPASEFNDLIQPFLAENCVACHNSRKKSGELDLGTLKTVESIISDREVWEHVVQKLETGEMPPKGLPRPDESELKRVVAWLERAFERADSMAKPDPGRVTARRLNRAEYNNTIRDLLGVDIHPAEDFPQDDSGYGFDNIGDVLSLSPVLMEKYISAAEKVARTAIFGREILKPTLAQYRPAIGRRIIPSFKPITDYDETGLSMPNSAHATHKFPVDGEYIIKAFLGGVRPLGSEPIQLGLWVDGKLVETKSFDPEGLASFSDDRQDFGGMAQQFRTRIKAGDRWVAISILKLYEGLPPSYGGVNPSKRPPPPPPVFRAPPNAPPERVAFLKKRFEERLAVKVSVNEARVGYLEVGGPYEQAKGPAPESIKKIYSCGHFDGRHHDSCPRKIVSNLARRAYRRPVTRQEIEPLLNLMSMAGKHGDSFEEGLALAIQSMLVSPHFLFRIEKDPAQPNVAAVDNYRPISQHELASRLSYFLWSSMPDDELMNLADQRQLRKPEVLAAQVRRMLKDEKSSALVENFGGQWLELRKLESVKPDRQRFPDFEEYLRTSMRKETELFFDNIVKNDGSILDFIDGNYTFLNQRLADFYGVKAVKGPEFRKVTIDDAVPRGGILTQASILTVSSYATRTSPVLRGKWILENILNAPPPPAPPGVPNLDEGKVGSAASLRQQLEEHRQNATCASCHSRMDPLGFGLENFDAIGAWRLKDGNFPVDSTGILPDGRKFAGPQELKSILKADSKAFAECLTEKLLTFALGRGLERYDKTTVRKIAANTAAKDYRFSILTLEIVNSLPFQNRRAGK